MPVCVPKNGLDKKLSPIETVQILLKARDMMCKIYAKIDMLEF